MISTASTAPVTPIVGIDVGKATCHIAIIYPGTSEPVALVVDRANVAAQLLAQLPADPPAVIALELTGSLAVPIITELEDSPHRLMIAQHTDTAALRQLLRSKRKTDKLDARLIAQLATLLLQPETAPLVAAHLTPWDTMRAAILGRAHTRHLQALIRDRVRLRLQHQYATLPAARTHLQEQITQLTAHIKVAETLLLATAGKDEHLLTTIPGVTLRRACILTAAIGGAARFPTADKLVKYCGLVPPHRPQSGTITGRPKIRRSLDLLHNELHMFALSVARYPQRSGRFGDTYQRVKARHGGRQAMWAAKRQLIRTCWGVLTAQQPYRQSAQPIQAGRLDSQPARDSTAAGRTAAGKPGG